MKREEFCFSFINNPVTANIGGGYKAKLSIDQAITNECNKTQPDTKKHTRRRRGN